MKVVCPEVENDAFYRMFRRAEDSVPNTGNCFLSFIFGEDLKSMLACDDARYAIWWTDAEGDCAFCDAEETSVRVIRNHTWTVGDDPATAVKLSTSIPVWECRDCGEGLLRSDATDLIDHVTKTCMDRTTPVKPGVYTV